MKPAQIMLGILMGTAVLCLFVMAYLWSSLPAAAHDWYSGTRDPSDGYGCCGGHDCNVINPRWVYPVEGGVRVVMTLEQARTINPITTSGVDAFVPENRIQHSPDFESHACVYDVNRGAPRSGIICFWLGQSS